MTERMSASAARDLMAPKPRRRKAHPESAEQRRLVRMLRPRRGVGLLRPNARLWCTENEGKRNAPAQLRFLEHGGLSGVPDLFVLAEGVGDPALIHGLEMKAPKGSKPTEAQAEFGAFLEACGHRWAWARGCDEALAILGRWGLLLTRDEQTALAREHAMRGAA